MADTDHKSDLVTLTFARVIRSAKIFALARRSGSGSKIPALLGEFLGEVFRAAGGPDQPESFESETKPCLTEKNRCGC